jgi:hypothetical protein
MFNVIKGKEKRKFPPKFIIGAKVFKKSTFYTFKECYEYKQMSNA